MQPMGVQGLLQREVTLRGLLPHSAPLPREVYVARHLALRILVLAHIPAIVVLGLVRSYGVPQTTLMIIPAALLVAESTYLADVRARAVMVTAGLSWCSLAVIYLSGGSIVAHFHLFLVISFVALYQDWAPFLVSLASTVATFVVFSAVQPRVLFGDFGPALRDPWAWSLVHLLAVAAVGAALVAFWRATVEAQLAATGLAGRMERVELEMAEEQAALRISTSELLTHLARRNQSLLGRQLTQLTRLGAAGHASRHLGELQVLASRMRRNADSLLVLSGAEHRGRWGAPEQLGSLLTRVVAQVADPARVQLVLRADAPCAGRAAADLAHLLTELVENAVQFTPPGSPVVVEAGRGVGGEYLVVVVDHGPGLTAEGYAEANARLAVPVDVTKAETHRLGFQVIGRLAARHGLTVSVAPGTAGGMVCVVTLPESVLAAAPPPVSAPAPPAAPPASPAPAAPPAPASGPLQHA